MVAGIPQFIHLLVPQYREPCDMPLGLDPFEKGMMRCLTLMFFLFTICLPFHLGELLLGVSGFCWTLVNLSTIFSPTLSLHPP